MRKMYYGILLVVFSMQIIDGNSEYYNDDYESVDNSSFNSESSEVFSKMHNEKPKRIEYKFQLRRNTTAVNCDKDTNCISDDNHKIEARYVLSKSHKYPFSVSVQRKGSHYATGALIKKLWVLTVAGEFYNVRESIKFFRARMGTINCKKNGAVVPIKRVEIHPSYVYKMPSFDIALLRMATPVEYNDFIKPISLSKIHGKIVSAKFLTTYWPRLIVKGTVLPSSAHERVKPNSMRVSTQKMIPWDWCSKLMENMNVTLKKSSLCLDPIISHHSSCLPDAGAPIFADDGLWGITSGWTSDNCLSQPNPTLFTHISSYLVGSWLNSTMEEFL